MHWVEDAPARASTKCYLSTPEHCSTFYGKYVYIYVAKGSLEATEHHLRFTSRRTSLDVEIASITRLQLGSFERAAKPTRLNRVELTYVATVDGLGRTVYLVPTRAGFMPTWKTNEVVDDWLEWLSNQQHTT